MWAVEPPQTRFARILASGVAPALDGNEIYMCSSCQTPSILEAAGQGESTMARSPIPEGKEVLASSAALGGIVLERVGAWVGCRNCGDRDRSEPSRSRDNWYSIQTQLIYCIGAKHDDDPGRTQRGNRSATDGRSPRPGYTSGKSSGTSLAGSSGFSLCASRDSDCGRVPCDAQCAVSRFQEMPKLPTTSFTRESFYEDRA